MHDKLKDKIKDRLIGKEINQNNYTDELILLLDGLGVEPNVVDFDFDRIYIAGYEDATEGRSYLDDEDEHYVCGLEVEYFEDKDENEFVRIVDVY